MKLRRGYAKGWDFDGTHELLFLNITFIMGREHRTHHRLQHAERTGNPVRLRLRLPDQLVAYRRCPAFRAYKALLLIEQP
ncbi:hypothetical protein D3C80_1901200 [compost metagenome]